MKGSELSHGLFFHHVLPIIRERFPDYLSSISAAHVREGSDVLGFDDVVSQDHNFGPRIALFLPDELHRHLAAGMMHQIRSALPDSYDGFPLLWNSWAPAVRILPLLQFHREELDLPKLPSKNLDWLRCDEQKLLELTAGPIFHDPAGQLTSLRRQLVFYPPGIRLFLLRLCFFRMSETAGVERSIRRQDRIAITLYVAYFIYFAIRTLHLITRYYCPYSKWMAHSLRRIGPSESAMADRLEQLTAAGSLSVVRDGMLDILFEIGSRITDELGAAPPGKANPDGLVLLPFDWDAVIRPLSEAIPSDLAELSPVISPPGYWGPVFDYRGYGVSFRVLLEQNVRAVHGVMNPLR